MAARPYTFDDSQAAELRVTSTALLATTRKLTGPVFGGLSDDLKDANVLAATFQAMIDAFLVTGGIKNSSIMDGFSIALGKLVSEELPAECREMAIAMMAGRAVETAKYVTAMTTPASQTRQ